MATRAVHPTEVGVVQPPETVTMSPKSTAAATATATRLRIGQGARALAYLGRVVGAAESADGSTDGSVSGVERIRSSIVVDRLLQSAPTARRDRPTQLLHNTSVGIHGSPEWISHRLPPCTCSLADRRAPTPAGCGRLLPRAETRVAPVGQVVREGVVEVLPETLPLDGANPVPPAPRPIPRPARTPLTWSVIRSVRELFIVSA